MAQQLAYKSNLLDMIETSLVLIETSFFYEYIVFCDQLIQFNICFAILLNLTGFVCQNMEYQADLNRVTHFKLHNQYLGT